MPENRAGTQVLKDWVAKAESDWANMLLILKHGQPFQLDGVCFHAQQCIEKYIKALLTAQGEEVPKTHNLAFLLHRLPSQAGPKLTDTELLNLTLYAVGLRYPGTDAVTMAEAHYAVRVARRVRFEVRRKLPKAVLTVQKPSAKPKRKT